MKKTLSFLAACLFLTGLTFQPAQASTFYLNQSNTLADGVNYAQVDVTEVAGNLKFEVEVLDPTNWKFSSFFFNLSGAGAVNLTGLPSGWGLVSGPSPYNVSEFGLFSNGVKGTGNSLQDDFSFIADGANDLTIANLVENNKGWIFAGHTQCQNKNSSPCSKVDYQSSHFISGTGDVSNVPLPAAVWLFGSAIAGLGTLKRRKNG